MKKISPISFSSCFCFGHGAIKPASMAEKLAENGFETLPLTDKASFAGLPEAIRAADKFNLKLLAGQQFSDSHELSILLFPDDETGYTWLNRLASYVATQTDSALTILKAYIQKFPPIGNGRCLIKHHSLATSASIFKACGWSCFLSINPETSNREITDTIEIARRNGFRLILSPNLLCADKDDLDTVKLIRAIASGRLLNDVAPFKADLPQISSVYSGLAEKYPEAAAANREFAMQATWVPAHKTLQMPIFCPSSTETVAMLQQIARTGLQKRYPVILPAIEERFNHELQTIIKLGFADYFMVVHDITTKARELGHRVLGRGSAANSIVSYALGFTQVDPIKHSLYFERFLNESRRSPPDIDLDFSWRIRDQIYQHLLERWGNENVAMISTHISLRGRSALREAGKSLGYKNEDIGFATSLIRAPSLVEFLQSPQQFSRFSPPSDRLKMIQPLIKLAARIENIPTHYSIHAGGVVIAPGSLYRFTPVVPGSKVLPITQLEMHGIEDVGLVKLDLLSQRALGVYSDMIEHTRTLSLPGCPEQPEQIEEDPAVIASLAAGETMGVFYIESPGMRGLLQKLRCGNYQQLVAASSIIRPGVAESGMMQEYIRRHHQPDNWKPVHPLLGELLAETYGVMVYQEDVMKVAHHIAGFTLAEADVLRRAMSGKERGSQQMNGSRDQFIKGACCRGIEEAIALEIWRQISSFCGYAFCKAHSASYAVLSMELLWFKKHFPGVFMAAVINNRGGFYGTQAYISEARRMGLTIVPPDVCISGRGFSCSAGELITGLGFIGGLKNDTIDRILAQRQKNVFTSLEDFLERVRPDEREFSNLVDSGACRQFGPPAACRWREKLMLKNSLFAEPVSFMQNFSAPLPQRIDLIKAELLSMGFAVSGHPIELYREPVGSVLAEELHKQLNRKVKVFGLLVAAKSVTTSSGAGMKFLTLEDRTGLIEIVFFPAAWKKNPILLEQAAVLEVSGMVKSDNGQITIHGELLKKY